MNGDDESTSLLTHIMHRPDSGASYDKDRLGRGILWNRILILLGLVALVGGGLYTQHEIIDLNDQLMHEQHQVHELDAQLQIHQQVIDRFNTSITNHDVVDRLDHLAHDLSKTETRLQHELEATQANISQQLATTLSDLSATVAQAEDEIHSQVDKVKRDVDQYVITTQDQFSMENSFMVYQLAGTFTLLSCLISMWHMTAHLRKFSEPNIQRKVLAILWMSPIYAITSWFSLVFHQAQGYLAIIKDGYEAYIIYQFLSFCIAVLGKGNREKVVDLLAHRADHLTPPFRLFGLCESCCCKKDLYDSNRHLADAILLQCQVFAMQFVFFRPMTTTAMVVLNQLNYTGAGDGPTDYRSPQFWLVIVQNISIFTAFAGLLKFYHAVDEDLAWCRPFAKFLCIKGIVFLTFWQGLVISVLAQFTEVGGEQKDEWAQSAQNFLICLEMLLFSIAHFYCFPTEEWQEGYRVKHSQGQFGDSIALGDFFKDLKLILRRNGAMSKKKPKHATIPEGDREDDGEDEADDVDVESTATEALSTADARDDKAEVARLLERSLGAAHDDADIQEAKQRLIDSNMISLDFFDGESEEYMGGLSDSSLIDSDVMRPSDDEESIESSDDESSTVEDGTAVDRVDSLPSGGRESSYTSLESRGETLSEQTPLRSKDDTSARDQVLRPSIWTQVVAEDDDNFHDADSEHLDARRDKDVDRSR